MEDTFMASLQQEGSNPFGTEEKETEAPSESPTEIKPETDEPTQGDEATKEPVASTEEDNEPFHRRWKVREEKLKTELDEKYRNDFEDYKREIEQKLTTSKPTAPQFITEMVGENEQVAKSFNQYEQELAAKIERQIVEKQELARVTAQREEQRWNSWIDEQVDSLKDEGHQFDRNELLKVVLDYRPTDENNNYDFRAALKILQLQKPAPDTRKAEARKALADATTSGSAGDSTPKDYVTAKDLRNVGWSSL